MKQDEDKIQEEAEVKSWRDRDQDGLQTPMNFAWSSWAQGHFIHLCEKT